MTHTFGQYGSVFVNGRSVNLDDVRNPLGANIPLKVSIGLCDEDEHEWNDPRPGKTRWCIKCKLADATLADLGHDVEVDEPEPEPPDPDFSDFEHKGYVPADPDQAVEGHLHYTDMGSTEAFVELLRRHGLKYAGETCRHISPYRYTWARPDESVVISTAANPIIGEREDHDPTSGNDTKPYDRDGYLSYVYVKGEFSTAKPLWDDILESNTYNKGLFRPLASFDIETDDIPRGHWEVPESDDE